LLKSSSFTTGSTSPDGVDFHPLSFQPPTFETASNAGEAEAKRKALTQAHASTLGATPMLDRIITSNDAIPSVLPDVSVIMSNPTLYVGPTTESNWVILNKLMVGAYPASFDDEENDMILRSILQCRVTTFVCLQMEYQHGIPEAQWRAKQSLRPYIEDALDICTRERDKPGSVIVPPNQLKFLHTGIVDCGTTTDATVLDLSLDIIWHMMAGECVYLHCWGGHGRTGTVVAVTLGLMYGLSNAEALVRTQLYHDLRICSLNVPSPQTPQQRRQVERILDAVRRGEYPQCPLIPIIRPSAASPPPQSPSPRFLKTIKSRSSSLFSWDGMAATS